MRWMGPRKNAVATPQVTWSLRYPRRPWPASAVARHGQVLHACAPHQQRTMRQSRQVCGHSQGKAFALRLSCRSRCRGLGHRVPSSKDICCLAGQRATHPRMPRPGISLLFCNSAPMCAAARPAADHPLQSGCWREISHSLRKSCPGRTVLCPARFPYHAWVARSTPRVS